MSCLCSGLVCVSPRIYCCFFIVWFFFVWFFLRQPVSVFNHRLMARTWGSECTLTNWSPYFVHLIDIYIIRTLFFEFVSTHTFTPSLSEFARSACCTLLFLFFSLCLCSVDFSLLAWFFLINQKNIAGYVWRRFVVSVTAYWNGLNYWHAD